jgi:ubiquinone/menaquinone biosynthesis C-methylase UbiE
MTSLEKRFVNAPGHARNVADHALRLLSRVDYKSGWRYLDVGCGVGSAAREIAAASELAVTAIDVDPRQIEIARAGAARPNLQFAIMDTTKLEYPDGQFDVVSSHMATHHIPDWDRAFLEMVRVLRTGGYLIYRDFMFPAWLEKIGRRLIRQMGFPSADALRRMAARAGLSNVYESHGSGKVDLIWIKNG